MEYESNRSNLLTVLTLTSMLVNLCLLFKIVRLVGGLTQIPRGRKGLEFKPLVWLAIGDISVALLSILAQARKPFDGLNVYNCEDSSSHTVFLLCFMMLMYGSGFAVLAKEWNSFKEQARLESCKVVNSGGRVRIPITFMSLSVSGVFWGLSLILIFSHEVIGVQFDPKFCSFLLFFDSVPSTWQDFNFLCLIIPVGLTLIACSVRLGSGILHVFATKQAITIRRQPTFLPTPVPGISPLDLNSIAPTAQTLFQTALTQPPPPYQEVSRKSPPCDAPVSQLPHATPSSHCDATEDADQTQSLSHHEPPPQALCTEPQDSRQQGVREQCHPPQGAQEEWDQPWQRQAPVNPGYLVKPAPFTQASVCEAAPPPLPPRLSAHYLAREKAVLVSEIFVYCMCSIVFVLVQHGYNLTTEMRSMGQLYLIDIFDLVWWLLTMRGCVLIFVRIASGTASRA